MGIRNILDRLVRSVPVVGDWAKAGVSGQTIIAGGVAGDLTVAGILKEDQLVSVINLTDAEDITSEFAITDDATINNASGSTTATDSLLVSWNKFDGRR